MTISEFPVPDSMSLEMQVIADVISLPETLLEAERTISADMFADEKCRSAWETLRQMSKEGMVIDLPSAYTRIDRELMQKGIVPTLANTGSAVTALQHYTALKEVHIKRKCYFAAMQLLIGSTAAGASVRDLIGQVSSIADGMRKEADAEKSTQHISVVLNELGDKIEETIRNKAEGRALRVPTGIYTLDYLTYGGYNEGNLIILAARPSVGKTAIMLQMAKAAAAAGKSVNLFNLEMTNTELAQRLLFSTGMLTPLQVAKGEVVWGDFECASGQFASRPIYLNDSSTTDDEIVARITMNKMAGKCDIAFIDYLGLIRMNSRLPLREAIEETTKRLKNLAKACRIPIVLLCQLNRSSAYEKRPPMLHDLRDSGSIEQDADIVLMLERASEDESGKTVNMWVRKNRQGKAGEVKIELMANETFSAFSDVNDPTPPPITMEDLDGRSDFDNDDVPF